MSIGPTAEEIVKALDECEARTFSWRAMRVTMECGHLRLTEFLNTTMGIGAYTACRICPLDDDGTEACRQVVNIEETGTLHEDWARNFSERQEEEWKRRERLRQEDEAQNAPWEG